jgi:hypothetical protein
VHENHRLGRQRQGLQVSADFVPAYRAFSGGEALLGTLFLGAGHPAWRRPV